MFEKVSYDAEWNQYSCQTTKMVQAEENEEQMDNV